MASSSFPHSDSTSGWTGSLGTLDVGMPEIALHDDNESSLAPSNIGNITPATNQAYPNEENKARLRGRKGHSKSRTGCYNCKKARIKCRENRPSCDYCSHRDLKCEWPDLQISQVTQAGVMIRKPTPSPIPASIRSQGPVFTMQDFRLFNHFIQTAYPHHPPNNDSIWTHEIPGFASDYDFLLHSMLALSASDILESSPSQANSELECVAISHRVKAISSLNEAIGKPIASVEEGNAIIATCFSLLFQSTLMNEGLVEYMTFIRGLVVVSMHMGEQNIAFLFEHLFDQAQVVESELAESPLIDPEHARRACRSLELFYPLVQNPREKELYGHLLSTARALFTSSQAGAIHFNILTTFQVDTNCPAYTNLAKIYGLFSYFMSHEEFAMFIDPNNEAGKLLQSHFGALQLIMTPFTRRETAGSRRKNAIMGQNNDGTTARWLVALHRNIKPEMRPYYEWPIWVENAVAARKLKLRWDDDVPSAHSCGNDTSSWTQVGAEESRRSGEP